MVLRELGGDAVLCIGQPAHAWLSAQLAREWGNARFAAPEPRAEVVLAAAQHDLGMAGWDAAPGLNPRTGWPRSFLEMAPDVHLALWSRAPGLALAQSRWAALLVSMHGSFLLGRRAGEPGVDGFLAEQERLQARLRESLGVEREHAARLQRLLAAWDLMSLALCRDDLPVAAHGAEHPVSLEAGAGEGEVRVLPWPFRDERVRAGVEARRLDGRFDSEPALHAALDAAPWQRLEFTLIPG